MTTKFREKMQALEAIEYMDQQREDLLLFTPDPDIPKPDEPTKPIHNEHPDWRLNNIEAWSYK